MKGWGEAEVEYWLADWLDQTNSAREEREVGLDVDECFSFAPGLRRIFTADTVSLHSATTTSATVILLYPSHSLHFILCQFLHQSKHTTAWIPPDRITDLNLSRFSHDPYETRRERLSSMPSETCFSTKWRMVSVWLRLRFFPR